MEKHLIYHSQMTQKTSIAFQSFMIKCDNDYGNDMIESYFPRLFLGRI